MKCNNSCVYYVILGGTNLTKDKPVIKILCDYREKCIKNISDQERHNCPHYKSKEDIKFKI